MLVVIRYYVDFRVDPIDLHLDLVAVLESVFEASHQNNLLHRDVCEFLLLSEHIHYLRVASHVVFLFQGVNVGVDHILLQKLLESLGLLVEFRRGSHYAYWGSRLYGSRQVHVQGDFGLRKGVGQDGGVWSIEGLDYDFGVCDLGNEGGRDGVDHSLVQGSSFQFSFIFFEIHFEFLLQLVLLVSEHVSERFTDALGKGQANHGIEEQLKSFHLNYSRLRLK